LKEEIKRYDDLGVNLFELPLGCSVKVDLDSVVYPTSAVLSYPIARNLIRVPGVQVFIPNILGWELGLVATYFGLFLYFLLIYRLEKSYGKVKVVSLKK
jgi:hypothetical protein